MSVARFVAELGSLEPHGIAFGPNGDLQFVAEPIAHRKLEQLGQAKRMLAQAA
jgi:hypothetical protein